MNVTPGKKPTRSAFPLIRMTPSTNTPLVLPSFLINIRAAEDPSPDRAGAKAHKFVIPIVESFLVGK